MKAWLQDKIGIKLRRWLIQTSLQSSFPWSMRESVLDSDFPDPLCHLTGEKIQACSASHAAKSKKLFFVLGKKCKSVKWMIFRSFNLHLCELQKDFGNRSDNNSVLAISNSTWDQTKRCVDQFLSQVLPLPRGSFQLLFLLFANYYHGNLLHYLHNSFYL